MRRRFTGKSADRMAGVLAEFDGQCWVCDKPIFRMVSQVVKRRDDWVHTTCAPGADDGAIAVRTVLQVVVVTLPLIVAALLAIHLGHSPPS